MNEPSATVVILPPRVVAAFVTTVTARPGPASLARRLVALATYGVAGVVPLKPMSCVLPTPLYDPPDTDGATWLLNEAEPVQVFASVAVTVKVNEPVVVGVPLMAPPLESARPGGNVPAAEVTAKLYAGVPPLAVKLWPA